MNEERIWLLLGLKLSNEATPEELAELENILRQQPQLAARAAVISNLWQSEKAAGDKDIASTAFDKHLQRLSNHLSAPSLTFETGAAEEINPEGRLINLSTRKRRWYWIAAAGIAATLFLIFTLLIDTEEKKPLRLAENTVTTKAGSKSKIQLPDGTQVWLNADSRIEYGANFNVKLREVKLTGEAFFDVVKNKEKPFIIHTSQMDVRVLGTAFNVRSYPEETTTETALLRGAVEITLNNNPDKKYYLKPNDKLVLSNNITAVADSLLEDNMEKQEVKLKKVRMDNTENDIVETMWVKNKLAFDNEALEKILTETERWYNVQIELKSEKVKAFRFTGVFENKPITDVLEALCLAAHLRYEVKGAQVTVW